MKPELFQDEEEIDNSKIDVRSRQCPYLDTINRYPEKHFFYNSKH